MKTILEKNFDQKDPAWDGHEDFLWTFALLVIFKKIKRDCCAVTKEDNLINFAELEKECTYYDNSVTLM